MHIVRILIQIKTDNVPGYVSNNFFSYCNIKNITGILHNYPEQVVVERSNRILKEMLN